MTLFLKKNSFFKLIAFLAILIIVVFISYYNYLLFHLIVEFITAMTGYFMLLLMINTKKISQNATYILLAIAYTFIGSIDMMHAILYKGMNIVRNVPINTSIQLCLIARYTESISLVFIFSFIHKSFKEIKYKKVIAIYFFIFIYSIAIAFRIRVFPVCYIEGIGSTKFKTIVQYIIILNLLISLYLLKKNKDKYGFNKNEYYNLSLSIIFTILSEICFNFYMNIYGFSAIVGHVLKLMSFYCLYVPLVRKNLQEPYNIIFNNLNSSLSQLKRANNELFSKNNELEEMKSRLEESLKFYKNFIEVLPFSIIIRDKENMVYVNSKTKELLKINSKKEIIGRSLLDFLEEGCKEIARERIIMKSKNKMISPMEERILCSDGSIVDVEVSETAVFINNKEYFLAILKDITNLKKLKAVERELEEKKQYENIRNEFFSNISHELRTPVNVIYSALQLQEIYIDRKEYCNIKKNGRMARQNCMRLLRLINNLIDITKIDAGFFKPVIKCTNIVDIIENIVLSIAPYVESRKMNIIFDTELEEQYVNCDSDLIERIILNLISNSIKYGKDNGYIYVNIYNRCQNVVSISIKDDGIGIPKDKQQTVFERFIRVDKSLARSCEGSGIGLSLVKSLVEIQKGRITLKSEENLGTEFIIDFPVSKAQVEVCADIDKDFGVDNIIKKVDLEFSDIYDL